jgi:hypothetical protein
MAAWVTGIESVAHRLESLTLEKSLQELFDLHSGVEGCRREGLLSRLGWSGRQLTLAAAGREAGVTRERMRQLEERVRADLPAVPVYVPALMRALDALAAAAPIEASDAAALLKERGISEAPFAPESLIAAAADLHIDSPITLAESRGLSMVVDAGVQAPVAAILATARSMAGRSGIGDAVEVSAEVSVRIGADCSTEEVRRTLSASPHVLMLHGSWYWVTDLPDGRNRVAHACCDLLSVNAPLSVTCLWEGLKRWYTRRNVNSGSTRNIPPVEALRAFLQAHPDFIVNAEDNVRPTGPMDYRQRLSPAERTMVEVLRSAPDGVLDRVTLTSECARRGIGTELISVHLTYNPLFEHVGPNAWTVRGSHAHTDAQEGLMAGSRPAGRG